MFWLDSLVLFSLFKTIFIAYILRFSFLLKANVSKMSKIRKKFSFPVLNHSRFFASLISCTGNYFQTYLPLMHVRACIRIFWCISVFWVRSAASYFNDTKLSMLLCLEIFPESVHDLKVICEQTSSAQNLPGHAPGPEIFHRPKSACSPKPPFSK